MSDLLSDAPSPLDAAIGLVAVELLDDAVVLRLDPPAAALGGDEPRPFLHGGTLATCVDTAGWYALEHVEPRCVDRGRSPLRLSSPCGAVPHRVVGRCLAAGRTLGTADVEISAWDEPERLVAVGRARFMRGTASP